MARLYAEPIIWWMLRTVFGAKPFGFFLASMRSTRPPSNRCLQKRCKSREVRSASGMPPICGLMWFLRKPYLVLKVDGLSLILT